MESINSVLMTVPGIGAVNAACIVGEIGDIKRFYEKCPASFSPMPVLTRLFANPGSLPLNLPVCQSVVLPCFRYALINSAWQLTLNDTTFKAYYDLKRSQGLNHYGALGHVAHKLTRVIFKLLTSDTPFNPAQTCRLIFGAFVY